MSHITSINAEITDESALRQAAEKLGCEVLDTTTFHNYGRTTPCDFAIGHEDCNAAVGVVRKNGKLELWMDNWDDIKTHVGRNSEDLIQRYSTEVTIKAMKKKGYRVREQQQQDGSIKLYATTGAASTPASKRW